MRFRSDWNSWSKFLYFLIGILILADRNLSKEICLSVQIIRKIDLTPIEIYFSYYLDRKCGRSLSVQINRKIGSILWNPQRENALLDHYLHYCVIVDQCCMDNFFVHEKRWVKVTLALPPILQLGVWGSVSHFERWSIWELVRYSWWKEILKKNPGWNSVIAIKM